MAVQPNSPNVVYTGTANYCYCYDDPFPNGISRTAEGGTTPFNAGLTIPSPPFVFNTYSLLIDPFDPTTVYAGTSDGVFAATIAY